MVKADWERQRNLLCMIEHFGIGQKALGEQLLAFLPQADFYGVLRILLAVGRLNAKESAAGLADFIRSNRNTACQLFALDQFNQLPLTEEERYAVIVALLETNDGRILAPLTLRGLVWLLATRCGKRAMGRLLAFLHENRSAWVKEEFLQEALLLCAGNTASLAVYAEEDEKLARFLRYCLPADLSGRPHFSLYPSGDFLWHACLEQGFTREDFRRFFWFYRNNTVGHLQEK